MIRSGIVNLCLSASLLLSNLYHQDRIFISFSFCLFFIGCFLCLMLRTLLQYEQVVIIELRRFLPGLSLGISSQECAVVSSRWSSGFSQLSDAVIHGVYVYIYIFFSFFKSVYPWGKLHWLWVCWFGALLDFSLLTLFWKVRICDNVTDGSVTFLFFVLHLFWYWGDVIYSKGWGNIHP